MKRHRALARNKGSLTIHYRIEIKQHSVVGHVDSALRRQGPSGHNDIGQHLIFFQGQGIVLGHVDIKTGTLRQGDVTANTQLAVLTGALCTHIEGGVPGLDIVTGNGGMRVECDGQTAAVGDTRGGGDVMIQRQGAVDIDAVDIKATFGDKGAADPRQASLRIVEIQSVASQLHVTIEPAAAGDGCRDRGRGLGTGLSQLACYIDGTIASDGPGIGDAADVAAVDIDAVGITA